MGAPTLANRTNITDGNRRGVVVDVTPDDDYDATDGIPVTGADLGFGIITDARLEQIDGSVRQWSFEIDADGDLALRAYGRGGDSVVSSVSETCTKANMTDVTTTGTRAFTSSIPAGSIILGWQAVCTAAFSGDTTAAVRVGIAADNDRFSADTSQSVFTTGTVGSGPLAADVLDGVGSTVTPFVTVTTSADFTSVSGSASMVVTVYYIAAANPALGSITQSFVKSAMTDVTTTLTGDFTSTVPAGALILGWKAVTTVAFSGDTTATVQVGIAGDLDRFSADTSQSIFTAGTVGSAPLAADVLDNAATAITPRVTVTTTADATSVPAGATTQITVYYLDLSGGSLALAEVSDGADLSDATVRLTAYGN